MAHFRKAISILEGHLHEESRGHGAEIMFGQGFLDAIELSGHAFEFVFVTGEILLLNTLELHVLEEMNLVLVFDVPAPKGAFGDVDLLRDFIKAPAIGAKGHELADFR